jgi:hypothetical protein
MFSLLAGIRQDLANTTKELVADINNMNNNMRLFWDRVDTDHRSVVTEAITTFSGNTARLSEETSALSVRVIEHQGHLENLLGFEEARQAQMDGHWKSIVALTSQVGEVKTTTATQTQRIAAQLDGLRSNYDTTTIAMKNAITDLRGRIIPGLRDHSSTIVLSVKRLEERLEAYSKTPAVPVPLALTTTVPNPIATIPQEEQPTVPQEDRPNDSRPNAWYSRPHNTRFDNPFFWRTGFNPNERPDPIYTTTLDDSDEVSFVGGRITSPRSTDKE